jgi:formate dehydrogenase subunit gamma
MANLLRYSLPERVVHWISAIAYTYALATGAAFWSPHLYWIAILLGGAPTSRYWHPWVALVFLAALAWMLRAWLPDMRITAADRRWGDQMQHYIRNEDEDLPPIDRFNVGQKYFFWVMLWAGLVLLLSGLVLWAPELIPWSWRGLRYTAVLLHAATSTWVPRWCAADSLPSFAAKSRPPGPKRITGSGTTGSLVDDRWPPG